MGCFHEGFFGPAHFEECHDLAEDEEGHEKNGLYKTKVFAFNGHYGDEGKDKREQDGQPGIETGGQEKEVEYGKEKGSAENDE